MFSMSDSQTAVSVLRDNLRDRSTQERKECRNVAFNRRRGLLGEVFSENEITRPEQVKILAQKLKTKGQDIEEVLLLLKDALIQSEENIKAFLIVDGALHALIRELTGQNADNQLAAAYCCCNAALGNSKSCHKLAKSTSIYLLTYLDGFNYQLMETCAWALGNLAGSDMKTWLILQSQYTLSKLLDLLECPNELVVYSAIYALTHYVKTGLEQLLASELQEVAQRTHLLLEKEGSVSWLLYLLSCCGPCDQVLLNHHMGQRSVDMLGQLLAMPEADIIRVTPLVRVLGNLTAEESGQGCAQVLQSMEFASTTLLTLLQALLTSPHPHVRKEVVWLVENLLNHSSPQVQQMVADVSLQARLEPHLSQVIQVTLGYCSFNPQQSFL